MFAGVSTVEVIKDFSINVTSGTVIYTATKNCSLYFVYKVFNPKLPAFGSISGGNFTSVVLGSNFISGQTYLALRTGNTVTASQVEAIFDLYIFSNNDDI
jgi:hypothetical protein